MIKWMEKMARWDLNRRGLQSNYVETSVSNVHYFEGKGDGTLPEFVLLHGIASSATGYSKLIHLLHRQTRRLLAFDSPGHGWSSNPHEELTPEVIYQGLQEALDATIQEPVVLFGNSLGGAMAVRYAIERPEKLRALVLSSPAGAPISEEEYRTLRELFRVTSRKEARTFLKHLYHKTPWYRRVLERLIQQMIGRPHIQSFFENVKPQESQNRYFSPDDLSTLTPPTLFLWGQSERMLPDSIFQYYQKHLPKHSVIERPEHFAHSPHLEFPERLFERIRLFVQDTETG